MKRYSFPCDQNRYVILDALRAIAGLTIPMFHLFEAFERPGARPIESVCSHGYLAVEFFLLLMGYMLIHAYDHRWREGMGIVDFFKRRLLRLHPLVVSGVILGLVVYFCQPAGVGWISHYFKDLSGCAVLGIGLWAMTMIPVVGFGCLNPFNACSWTLYYEYAGNVFYALGLRKLNKTALFCCAIVALFFWTCYVFHVNINHLFGTHFAVFDEAAANLRWSIVGGWRAEASHVYCGFVRLAFPLFWGMLLARLGWKIRLPKGALWIAVAVFSAVLCTPYEYRLGGEGHYWCNSLFELAAVTIIFPSLLLVGVGNAVSAASPVGRVSKFLGELSYPLYMSHYMFMCLWNRWVCTRSLQHSHLTCILILFAAEIALVGVATLVMKFWDEPVRRVLQGRNGKKGVAA